MRVCVLLLSLALLAEAFGDAGALEIVRTAAPWASPSAVDRAL